MAAPIPMDSEIRLEGEVEVGLNGTEEIGDGVNIDRPRVEQGTCDVVGSSQGLVIGDVDWDKLQICERNDEEGEGMLDIIDEGQLIRFLGLREEEQHERPREAEKVGERDSTAANRTGRIDIDTTGAVIPIDDHVPGEGLYSYDPNKPCMDIGTVYPNMKEFRLAMKQFAINEEFEVQLVATDKTRYIANCAAVDCPWHINGRRQPDGTSIKVTVLVPQHNCTSSARRLTTTPSSGWAASKAIHHLKKNPNMRTIDLQKTLEGEHKYQIHYDTVWKGKQKAELEAYGTWQQSFQMLFNWRAEVLKRSPGSVIEIEMKQVDGKYYFHRFFCALRPCIDGFLEGCRPYLSIDSTALNGRWNGHMAAATAIDGHNWMYPVAFGFIDGETIENWTWFMTQLHKAIGDLPVLAISSDACKGLENAVKAVFPQAEHRECFRHLMQNFIKRFGGDIFSKMYPAARTYRTEVYNYFYNAIVTANSEVQEWLQNHHYLLWMRSAFNPEIKCDYVTNNLAEVFNNWVRDWKHLPIVELADKIREMIMTLWNKRREISEKLEGKIIPAVLQQLKAKTRGLGNLTVVKAGPFAAEVHDTTTTHNRHVVKSYLHTCTCGQWQHTGKPCQHALALITAQQSSDVQLEDFVHDYYSVQRFKNAYKRLIEPLPDKSQWPDVQLDFVLNAPLPKKGPGRPRELRIKGCLEGGSGGKSKKQAKDAANQANKDAELEAQEGAKGKRQLIRGKRKCKGCGELSHGEKSYKCKLNGTNKRPRKPRKNTTKYGPNAKVPTKRAKKPGKEAKSASVQAENENLQPENTVTVPANDVVMDKNAMILAEFDTWMDENAIVGVIVPFEAENSMRQPTNASPSSPSNTQVPSRRKKMTPKKLATKKLKKN